MSAAENKTSFFRQSGWMVIATVGGGAFMIAVHSLASSMQKAEYAAFFTLLRVFILLSIPAGGLQTVFAQQAAAALTEAEARQLTATTRAVVRGAFMVWLMMALGILVFRHQVLSLLKIANPNALYITLLLTLVSLWTPIVRGLLQGRQEFAGLGWVIILDGLGRFCAVAVFVTLLHGQAAGGMGGALTGQLIAIGVGAWMIRGIWMGQGSKFVWGPWLKRVVPLTLGTGAMLCMSSADSLFVQSLFSEDWAPLYMAGFMIGFGIIQFTTPLAMVMFPRIAKSAARAQKTDALRMTLLSTLVMGGLAAFVCALFPELPLRVLYFRKQEFFIQAAPLVPWFAWCILLVTMANVLVSNLLARERFEVVPWLVIIALGYLATLLTLSPVFVDMEPFIAFRRVVQILGGFSLVLLVVAARFNWAKHQ